MRGMKEGEDGFHVLVLMMLAVLILCSGLQSCANEARYQSLLREIQSIQNGGDVSTFKR